MPTIDYNTFIEMIMFSLAGLVSKLLLRIPTLIWSFTITPASIFYFWYAAIYGEATRILFDNIKEDLRVLIDLLKVLIGYFFTNTWEAIMYLNHNFIVSPLISIL